MVKNPVQYQELSGLGLDKSPEAPILRKGAGLQISGEGLQEGVLLLRLP